MPKKSGTERFLKGKKIAGNNSPVAGVHVQAQKRIINHRDGTQTVLDIPRMKQVFDDTLRKAQRDAMEKTMRKTSKGVNVTIGGKIHGERKTYKTPAAAKAALTRAYGKA